MRNTFVQELVELSRQRSNIALVVGDLGYSVVEPFAQEFPERFFNAGVAEQNMAGVAAGMASEGFHVFVYSIANFSTFRCAEQIRNDIAYHNLPVTVVSVGGGLAYGALGYSHHAIQDYALMRTFPNMLIAAPGDPFEVKACIRYLINNPGPSYLRLGKSGEACYHSSSPSVTPGAWVRIRDGSENKVVLTTGAALQFVMNEVDKSDYKDHSICSMPIWSIASKSLQSANIRGFEEVITVEDHLQDGGFGSWMAEACMSNSSSLGKLRIVALSHDICGMVGEQKTLNRLGGLSLLGFQN